MTLNKERKGLSRIADFFLRRAFLFSFIILFNLMVICIVMLTISYPFNMVFSIISMVSSILLVTYYTTIRRLGGLVPISEDLIFALIHMRCLITSNPPLITLFQKVGESDFYSKKFRDRCLKIASLTGHWGYSLPDSIKLVSREVPTKVEEQLLQRYSAIVATGADVREYLRLEYNTIFSEYKSAYGRMVDMLRVVLGVYVTLIGAMTFLISTLMLLGMIFGGAVDMVITSVIGMAIALLFMSAILYFVIRRPLFECKRSKSSLARYAGLLGIMGTLGLIVLFAYIVLTRVIMDIEKTSLFITLAGFLLLPSGILVKLYENRITEYDMFYPAFLRSYGEHLSVVPDLLESLKPLLTAELGKLRKLLHKAYAGLLNRIDPKIMWTRISEESGSELVVRSTRIFIDTIESGGETGESGALLSDLLNELFRLRLTYIQVFKTFEITLYVMHLIAVMLLIFVGGFMNMFSHVLAQYAVNVPAEFAGLFAFMTISPLDVSFIINTSTIILTLSNTIALFSVNPGSRKSIYYYLSILLIMTGIGLYLGSKTIYLLLGTFLIF